MRQKVIILVIFLNVFVFCEKVNIKCDYGYDGCQCEIKIDPVTSIPYTELECQYQKLDEFPVLNSIEPTNSLDLSHNEIKQLRTDQINQQISDGIIILKFCHNSIGNIDINFFDSFTNLKTLDLSHNLLTNLQSKTFEKISKLEYLDLSYNDIEVVSEKIFEKLLKLKTLDLSYNPLFNVLQNPTALMDHLAISENIEHLSLDNVGVTRIHGKCWNNFKKINYLSVADNPINEIPQTSSTLEYLDISGTNMTNLHENYFKYSNLKVLKMARMENLTTLPHFALYNLGNLEEFTLTDSNVEDFNEFIFGLMNRKAFPRNLKKFDLARNQLKTLNETYQFIFHETEKVDVSFNPWNCDCDLLWMKEVEFPVKRRSDMRCASPSELVNKIVMDLQPKDIPNCYPEIYGKKSHQTALLLLILLIFVLIVVITYLCLYSPSWSIKISSTKISPDSPYSINNDQM